MRAAVSVLALAALAAASAAAARPCKVVVTDAENGWPVPLVQLWTVNGQQFVTDNAGVIALDEPDLMDRPCWFRVEGHGYGVDENRRGERAVTFTPRPGGVMRVKVKRFQEAKRLGRIGGTGLFAESRKLGEHLDKPDQGEVGRDSVQCRPYRGRLFWLWGDTSMQDYALGIFNTTGAYTPLPAFPRLEPPVYPPYSQFTDGKGRVRGIIKAQGSGPIWVFGLIDLKDRDGRDRLGGAWSQIRGFCEAYKNGLCEWNGETEMFDVTCTLMDRDKGVKPDFFPDQNPARWTDPEGRKWLLYGNPFPHHRIPDSYEAWRDTNTWEEISWDGRKKELRAADGRTVEPVGGQMAYSAFLKKWVSVFQQKLNFGAIWYAEADSPFGPWTNVRQIVRHENYTFYNPVIHVEYGPDAPYLIFEGTYTDTFVDNPDATPRYNYTQVLYRLDLAKRK